MVLSFIGIVLMPCLPLVAFDPTRTRFFNDSPMRPGLPTVS
jgi:hypothetical protein